jgi:hypothetical protein
MGDKWDDATFYEFCNLRDSLREAKRNDQHHLVLQLYERIVEVDKRAGFLNIALYVFQKDAARAAAKLGDERRSLSLLELALERMQASRVDVGALPQKIAKLRARLS